jgi:hypothetical protein
MAVDTSAKRFSMLALDSPYRFTTPVPSGTVSAAARLAFLGKYSGISAAATSVVYALTVFVTTSFAQTLTVKQTAGHDVSVTTTDSFTLRTA